MTDFDNEYKQWLKDVPYLWLPADNTLANSKRLYLVHPDFFAIFDAENRIATLRWVVQTGQKDYFSFLPIGPVPERNMMLVLPAVSDKEIQEAARRGEFRVNGKKLKEDPRPTVIMNHTVKRIGAEPLELVPLEFGIPELRPPFKVACPISKERTRTRNFVYDNLFHVIKKDKIDEGDIAAIEQIHNDALEGKHGWKYIAGKDQMKQCQMIYEMAVGIQPKFKLRQTLAPAAEVKAGQKRPIRLQLVLPQVPQDLQFNDPVSFEKVLEFMNHIIYKGKSLYAESKLYNIERMLAEPLPPTPPKEQKKEALLEAEIKKIGFEPSERIPTKGPRKVVRRPVKGAPGGGKAEVEAEYSIPSFDIPDYISIWYAYLIPLRQALITQTRLMKEAESDIDLLVEKLADVYKGDDDYNAVVDSIRDYKNARDSGAAGLDIYNETIKEYVSLKRVQQTKLQKKVGYKPPETVTTLMAKINDWKDQFKELRKTFRESEDFIKQKEKELDNRVKELEIDFGVKDPELSKLADKYQLYRNNHTGLEALDKSKLLAAVWLKVDILPLVASLEQAVSKSLEETLDRNVKNLPNIVKDKHLNKHLEKYQKSRLNDKSVLESLKNSELIEKIQKEIKKVLSEKGQEEEASEEAFEEEAGIGGDESEDGESEQRESIPIEEEGGVEEPKKIAGKGQEQMSEFMLQMLQPQARKEKPGEKTAREMIRERLGRKSDEESGEKSQKKKKN